MHIALFSPAWPIGRAPNGIVTYVDALRTGLHAQGHRVSIVSPDVGDMPGAAVHQVALGLADRLVGAVRARTGDAIPPVYRYGKAIVATFERVHARSPIDVIEMEESFGFVGQVARRTNIATVVKLHGPAFLTMNERDLRTAWGQKRVQAEREALASLPVITSPSRCTLDDTLSAFQLNPAIAAHVVNPVALPAEAPLWRAEACTPGLILFVGRFDLTKGGDLMVLAFRRLLVEHPDLRLLFVGPDSGLQQADGSTVHLPEYLASFDDPLLLRQISMRGVLEPPQIQELRAQAAVTVIPSRRESQGYTALEAMLQGCPVVSTDTSGLGEIVEHEVTGLKARPDDADDLARAISRLLFNRELPTRLGAAARAYVADHHSPAVVVKQTIDVYRRAIGLHQQRGQ